MGNLAGPLFYTHLKTPLLEADLDVLGVSSPTCASTQAMDWQDAPHPPLRGLSEGVVDRLDAGGLLRLDDEVGD